jgi:hypothetical protein
MTRLLYQVTPGVPPRQQQPLASVRTFAAAVNPELPKVSSSNEAIHQ